MGTAICFKCGAAKSSAFDACQKCDVAPRTNSEQAVSLALSGHLSSQAQLLQYGHEIGNGEKVSVPREVLIRALNTLKDPQLRLMLESPSSNPRSSIPTSPPANPMPDIQTDVQNSPRPIQRSNLSGSFATTKLDGSPFMLLGATTRDNRRRIVELADEKSLDLAQDICQKARSDLTNPRTRLGVELSWLPGVSPRRVQDLIETLHQDPTAARSEVGLPILAQLNLEAAVFESVSDVHNPDDMAHFIAEFASLADDLDPEDVLRDVNEDRLVSGFPQVNMIEQVETELVNRKRYYRDSIKRTLDSLLTPTLIRVMTNAVDDATSTGTEQAPSLIDDLVDSYEVETQDFLQKEAENAKKLITEIRDAAPDGVAAVQPYVEKLDTVTRNWDQVAQPIQLSARARGTDHEPSQELGYAIRNLAIDLYNKYDMLMQAQRLTSLLQELFAELPEVSERLEEDAEALDKISENKNRTEAQEREWEQSITYSVDIGAIFKDTFSISPTGIVWKGQSYPLNSITRVRWGGVRHSINGIPTGTTYTVAFGDHRSEAIVELRKKATYSALTDKLWRAVCMRLIGELVDALKAENRLRFGDAVVCDDHVILVKHKMFGRDEPVRCGWNDVHIWNAGGSLCIGAKSDKKTYAQISYILLPNTHILEAVIRIAFKHTGNRLSEAF